MGKRVRYAEDSGDQDEVRFFIWVKGLKLHEKYPQLDVLHAIEEALKQFEPVE